MGVNAIFGHLKRGFFMFLFVACQTPVGSLSQSLWDPYRARYSLT